MAVIRSPFSNYGSDEPTNIFEEAKPRPSRAVGVIGVPSTAPLNAKSSKTAEQTRLDSAMRTALAKIASSPVMTFKQKEAARQDLFKIYDSGTVTREKPNDSILERALKAVGGIALGPIGAAGRILSADAAVSRYTQSAIKELEDTTRAAFQGIPYVGKKLAPIVGTGSKPFSWDDFVRQGRDKDFRAVEFGNKFVDGIIDFATDTAFSPSTYVGVGPINYVGKVGRSALVARLGTKEMMAKYPQLAGQLDNIMRYGAAAVPKEVRAAEGIEYGIRFAGRILPKTDSIAAGITGKRGIASNVRAGIGDVMGKTATGTALRQALTPSSRAGFVAAQIGRNKGLDDVEVKRHVAAWTASKYAKGYKSSTYKKFISSVPQEVVEYATKVDASRLTAFVDNPALVPPPELAPLVDAFRTWQNGLLEEVNAIYRKFGVDYSADISEINRMDNFGIHHKITPQALRTIYTNKGVRTNFRDADLMFSEIGGATGAAMHRKYRAPRTLPDGTIEYDTFWGEKLMEGTIDEVNRIWRAKGKFDFDFFQTDLMAIADSYAYSMATARSRESFVRRLMDFGDDVAQPLLKKAVPDAQLVAGLEKNLTALRAARSALLRAVNKGRSKVVRTADDAVKFAEDILEKKSARVAKGLARTDAELAKVETIVAGLERDVHEIMQVAATKNAEDRGAFVQIYGAVIEEVKTLKNALAFDKAEELAAYNAVKKAYMEVFPNAKRVPKNVDQMMSAIKRAQGIKDAPQNREVLKRLKEVETQIRAMGDADPDALADLMAQEEKLTGLAEGFDVLAQVREGADYAEDGLLYGSTDDFAERVFDPNREPVPRVMSTRPMGAGDETMSTDEIAALRQGFREDPNSVAVHALHRDEVIDMREPESFRAFFDPEIGGAGDAVGFALRQSGIDPDGMFTRIYTDILENGVDPTAADIYPEIHDIVELLVHTGNHQFPDGVVDDDLMVDIFDTMREMFMDMGVAGRVANPELAADTAMMQVFRAMAEEGFERAQKPILVPSGVLYRKGNPMAEGAYSVVFPDAYSHTAKYGYRAGGPDPMPDWMFNTPTSPVHMFGAEDSEFVNTIYDDGFLDSSFDIGELASKTREEAEDLAAKNFVREGMEQEVRNLRGQAGALKGSGTKRIQKAEQAVKTYQESGTIDVTIGGRKATYTRESAVAELTRREERLNKAAVNLRERVAKRTETAERQLVSTEARLADQRDRVLTLLDQRKVLANWNDATSVRLREDIDLVRQATAVEPPTGPAGAQTRAWLKQVDDRLQAVDGIQDKRVKKAYDAVVTQLHADEAQLWMLDSMDIPFAEEVLKAAKAAEWGPRIVNDTLDGWSEIEKFGIQVPDEVLNVFKPNLEKLRNPEEFNKFKDLWYLSTQAMKIYATGTIGFIVRNAYSAQFMNFVAGVSTANMRDGLRAAIAYTKHGPNKWLDEMGVTDKAERDLWEMVIRGTDATGRGVSSDFIHPVAQGSKGEKIINNFYTRWFARKNDFVERAVRMPMILDSLRRGQTYDEAVYRTTRYHFDYSDLSRVDDFTKKNIVPFWIFATRNVPLQVTEQLLRPSTYTIYERFRERHPVEDGLIVPSWLGEMGPMGVVGNMVFNPDLPHIRLEQTVAQLSQPARFASTMYPYLKLPLELGIADKQLAFDIPFSDKYQDAKGLDWLMAKIGEIAGADNIARRDEDGNLLINPRASYGLNNLFPLLAQIQRLSGGVAGGKPSYEERQLTSILSNLGIPLRQIGESEQRGELIGRQFKIGDLVKELKNAGLVD
jgi:hypothetical protein